MADTEVLLLPPPPSSDAGPAPTGEAEVDPIQPFFRVAAGGEYRRDLRMTNKGPRAASVRLVRVDQAAQRFRADLSPGEEIVLGPGESTTRQIFYEPGGGTEDATFVFDTCGGGGCLVSREATGIGVLQAFECEVPALAVRPGRCADDFIICTNVTDHPVTVDEVSLSGSGAPYFFLEPSPVREVAGGADVLIHVTFCPFAFDPVSATVEVFAGVPNGTNVSRFEIAGVGDGGGELSCEADPLIALGPVPVGSRDSEFLPCRATGTLRIDGLALLRPGTPFTAQLHVNGSIQSTPAVVDELDDVQVEVIFAPTTAGEFIDTLAVEIERTGNLLFTIFGRTAESPPPIGYTIVSIPNQPLAPNDGEAFPFSDLDDGFASIPIGFPFVFAGMPVTTAHVSTNGLIGFASGAPLISSWLNETIPFGAEPNAFIAWWWDDLDLDSMHSNTSSVTTKLVGAEPSRVRVFSFTDVTGFAANAPLVNAEVRLFEGTNVIEVHYGALLFRGNDFSASAGWESFGGPSFTGADALGCSPACTSSHWPSDTILRYVPLP